jgi:hypothetical protein
MLRKGWMSKAALVAALAVAPNVADAAMFMTGDFPFGSVQAGPEAVEGTFNARIVLVNTTGAEIPEGSTLTVELPEGFTLTGLSGGGTGSILRSFARPAYNGGSVDSLTNAFVNSGGLGPIAVESDAACGSFGIDVDPTSGLVWMLVGRTSNPAGCYRTADRWLVRWDPNGATFRWISGQYGANGMMFMSDGTLIVIGGSAMSRGSVYTVDKVTGSRTYRTRPRSSQINVYAHNPNDGYLYGVQYCNGGNRVNTADWTSSTPSESDMCGHRPALAYESGNTFLFMNGNDWRRWTVNPTNRATVSNVWLAGGAPAQNHGLWSAGLDVATDGVTCDGGVCTVIALPAKTHAVVEIAGTYSLPANMPPANIVGQLVWRDEAGNELNGSDLGLRIIAPDLAVSVVASATNVIVNDQFDYDVEVFARGGVDVNGAQIDVALPANVRLVSVSSSTGDCGMTRTGARCVNLDVAADDVETITVTVEATADGLAAATVSIVEPTGDPVPSNDQDTASVVVGDTIDLAVSGGFAAAAAAPGDVALGAATPVTFTVVNRGPSVVTSTATVPLAGFELESVSTDVGTCTEDTDANVVRCTFGDFALHTTATVSMSVKPTSFGRPKLTMTASSALVDHTPGNDSYSLKFNVAAPSLSVALSNALGSSDGGRKVVAHLVASFETSTGQGASLREVTGTASFLRGGVAASGALVAYRDVNGDGNIGEGDGTLGSARVSATDGVFRLVFDAPVAVTGGGDTHILFVAEPSAAQVAALGAGSDAERSLMLGLAPFAMAGLLALRRRRTIWALALVAGLGGMAGCGLEDTLDDLSSSATVQVTVQGVRATIEGDVGVVLDIDGLPLSTGRVSTGN